MTKQLINFLTNFIYLIRSFDYFGTIKQYKYGTINQLYSLT